MTGTWQQPALPKLWTWAGRPIDQQVSLNMVMTQFVNDSSGIRLVSNRPHSAGLFKLPKHFGRLTNGELIRVHAEVSVFWV